MLELLIALAIIGFLNLCFYFGFYKFAFGTNSSQQESQKQIPVSVIICAKNEAENLKKFLPAILSQDHQEFEVVIINDASQDETLEIMEDFEKKDPRVKIVDVQNNEAFWGHKKYALTLGIKKAVNPYLLFTDADCQPQSNRWISEMSARFMKDTKTIVLGYGGYFVKKRSFLNKLIRYETLLTAIQYFSYAKWGIPYMGVGRNLAYTSEEFFKHNGFASHLHVRAGDDDLFVNQAATKENINICDTKEGSTRSIPKTTFKDWFTQKKRHISVAGNYKFKHRLLLALFFILQFSFWIIFIVLLFSNYWKLALAIYLVRILFQIPVIYKAGKKLSEKDIFLVFPLLEPFLIFTQFVIFIANIFSKPTHWK